MFPTKNGIDANTYEDFGIFLCNIYKSYKRISIQKSKVIFLVLRIHKTALPCFHHIIRREIVYFILPGIFPSTNLLFIIFRQTSVFQLIHKSLPRKSRFA